MKRGWAAFLLVVPLLAGCIGGDEEVREAAPPDVGYDAEQLDITGYIQHDLTIPSGSVELDAILYEPQTRDTIDGEDPRWPLVVMVHPWGFPKETYQNAPLSTEGQAGEPQDLMAIFAESGLMVIAYDTRGWGQSGGESTAAGPAEMRDLRNVINYTETHYRTNGNVGVTGISYGGGHAFNAWATMDEVDTVVPHNAWVDLFLALFPGNVPKLEWGVQLYGTGEAGFGGGGSSPAMTDWMNTMTARQDVDAVDGVHNQLDVRSILDHGVKNTEKPIFMCSGLQDTLFNQNHLAWMHAPGFVRAQYYDGGHNTLDEECWLKTRDWFQFFLAGIDTGVDAWPFLTTPDVTQEGPDRTYSKAFATQAIDTVPYYLRENQLVDYDDESRTFNVTQRVVSNPFTEPGGIWENTGQPYQAVPEQFRQDPSGVFFDSAPIDSTHTLLGAPHVTLVLDEETETPFQVTATLYLNEDGNLRILGRGATSPLAEHHLTMDNATGTNLTTVDIPLPFIKVDVNPGDVIVLELASSDPSIFSPLLANFDAAFTGQSRLDVPFFDPPSQTG